MIEDMITQEMVDALPEDQRASFQQVLDNQRRRKELIAEKSNAGDWDGALLLCDSQERPAIFVRAAEALEGEELRDLVADWWASTEGWSGDSDLGRGMMAAIRKAAPVIVPSDDPGRPQTPPEGRFRVYRGNLGETPQGGSWTLDKEVAENFARMASGLRGRLVLGMTGPGPASVWTAECDAEDVLGFFDNRLELEIVTDRVWNVQKIAEAVE